MTLALEETTVAVGEVRLHVVSAGPTDGPLAVLLHGFPEHARTWAPQIAALAGAGFRVMAPDQRGYNLSDKPAGVAAYHLDRLAGDVVGLLDAAGREQAYLVGHDWGGGAAWWTAMHHARRIAKLAIINMPHPQVLLRRHLRYSLHRCWYFYFFMLPRLPEWVLARSNWRAVLESIPRTARPGTFSDADIAAMRHALAQPGAITAMINWYRACMRLPLDVDRAARVQVPTLVLWGARDRFISRTMAAASVALCDQGRLEMLEDATHWVHHEEPERVSALLVDFFAAAAAPER